MHCGLKGKVFYSQKIKMNDLKCPKITLYFHRGHVLRYLAARNFMLSGTGTFPPYDKSKL